MNTSSRIEIGLVLFALLAILLIVAAVAVPLRVNSQDRVQRRPQFPASCSMADYGTLAFSFRSSVDCTTDGASLTTWNDQSGNGRNVTQGTSTKRPTCKNNGVDNLNGFPVLRFDGTDDFLKTSTEVSWPTEMSVFWVVKSSTGFPSYPLTGVGSVLAMYFQFDSATTWRFSGYNTSNAANGMDPTAISSGAWTVMSAMLRASTCELYANGSTDGSTARTGTNNSGNAHLTIGAYGEGTFGWLTGDTVELDIYFSDIGDTNRQGAQNCLGGRYGITIN